MTRPQAYLSRSTGQRSGRTSSVDFAPPPTRGPCGGEEGGMARLLFRTHTHPANRSYALTTSLVKEEIAWRLPGGSSSADLVCWLPLRASARSRFLGSRKRSRPTRPQELSGPATRSRRSFGSTVPSAPVVRRPCSACWRIPAATSSVPLSRPVPLRVLRAFCPRPPRSTSRPRSLSGTLRRT